MHKKSAFHILFILTFSLSFLFFGLSTASAENSNISVVGKVTVAYNDANGKRVVKTVNQGDPFQLADGMNIQIPSGSKLIFSEEGLTLSGPKSFGLKMLYAGQEIKPDDKFLKQIIGSETQFYKITPLDVRGFEFTEGKLQQSPSNPNQ